MSRNLLVGKNPSGVYEPVRGTFRALPERERERISGEHFGARACIVARPDTTRWL